MKKDLLKTILKIFPCLLKTKLSDIGAQYYIQCGYPDVAQHFVQACTDKEVVTEARTESYAELLGMDHHSVHAVAIIKNKIDTVDPFYIYKINDRKWNGSGTYIFKSSQNATEIGLAMDRTARQTPFRDLVAHMGGLHSCVKGFVTLTLWVKNPVSLITHRLACMEYESEYTTNVIHFLTLYNKILWKVKGDSSFVWSPRGIMTDENGANKNADRAVLGQTMAARTWSCTWYYLRCDQRQSLKFPKDDRKIFFDLAKSLAKDAVTTIQYNNIPCELRKMCTSTGWMKWLQFWHNRCEHFVLAFRGFFLPYMNIAESGQSGMRAQQPHGKMLSLVDGVYKDISKQMQCIKQQIGKRLLT